jgi:hypothetical protein
MDDVPATAEPIVVLNTVNEVVVDEITSNVPLNPVPRVDTVMNEPTGGGFPRAVVIV